MMKSLLRFLNGCVSLITSLALLTAGVYAGYCLWDNHQIYAEAQNVQEELLSLKPQPAEEAGEDGATFEALKAINEDVCAWVTLDNTEIDYPVVQGETNLEYLNLDVYGNFALAGSVFLDTRNENDFSDPYSILYGHHMENSAMFGDLDLYKDEEFFEENQTGTLILPDRTYGLQIFACLLVGVSEDRIFDPTTWEEGVEGLLDYAETDALYIAADTIGELRDRIEDGESPRVLALTTCASEFTDARTVILAAMVEYSQE